MIMDEPKRTHTRAHKRSPGYRHLLMLSSKVKTPKIVPVMNLIDFNKLHFKYYIQI